MKKKIILLIILLSLFMISAVSATSNNDKVSNDVTNDKISHNSVDKTSQTSKVLTTVKNTDDNELKSTAKTTKSKVTKESLKIGVNSETILYKKSQKYGLVVKNKKTLKPVKGIEVTMKVYTGKKYKTYILKTNKKGEASINTKSLSKGNHKVVIKTKATKKYKAASTKSSIKIVKNKIATFFEIKKMSYNYASNGAFQGVWVEPKLYDASGKEVGFKTVKAQIKMAYDNSAYGEQYSFLSNSGDHEVLCRLTGWDCYLQLDFDGDSVYKPCTLRYNL